MKNTLKTVDCETDCLALSPIPPSPHSPLTTLPIAECSRTTQHVILSIIHLINHI
ncbi:MAG: hypothetical protein J6R48_06220 [Muribaculaceae bacterium]|nr:hypothetical protein [Muribaculaceae bacterium]